MELPSPSLVNYTYSLSALAVLMSEVDTYRGGADPRLPVGGGANKFPPKPNEITEFSPVMAPEFFLYKSGIA